MRLPVSGTIASHTCFVYGTLMAPEVLQTLLGRVPDMDPRPAYLPTGYSRHPVKGRVFPAVIANNSNNHNHNNNNASEPEQQQDRVRGLILSGIHSDEMDRLDWFEADEYERRTLTVELKGENGNGNDNGNDNNDNGNDNDNNDIDNSQSQSQSEWVDAQVYIWCAGDHYLDLHESWSFKTFSTETLGWYLRSTVRPCRDDYDNNCNRNRDRSRNRQE